MAKNTSHMTPLADELQPAKSSTELICDHIERLRAQGVPQKVVALSLGFGPNYISMLKRGEDLALPRVIAFAAAARLSDEERRELLHARMVELHGESGVLCLETIAIWAQDVCSPEGDDAKLLALWREATAPAPHLLVGLLADPAGSARIQAAMQEVVQQELRLMAEEASLPG